MDPEGFQSEILLGNHCYFFYSQHQLLVLREEEVAMGFFFSVTVHADV